MKATLVTILSVFLLIQMCTASPAPAPHDDHDHPPEYCVPNNKGCVDHCKETNHKGECRGTECICLNN